jgi:hypothetical protein
MIEEKLSDIEYNSILKIKDLENIIEQKIIKINAI